MIRIPLLLILFCLTPASVQAAVALITVGDDANCDFRTLLLTNALQSAIDAVPLNVPEGDLYVIRVARSGDYNATTVDIVDRELLLEGGYADCGALERDPSMNTIIDGGGINAPLIDIRNSIERKTVTLRGLTLQHTRGTIASGVAVVSADIELSEVTVQDHTGAIRGAGMRLNGGALGASAHLGRNTLLISNEVSQEGGGVYCSGGARLEVSAQVGISGNTALQGGGIYANHCSGYINAGGVEFAGLFFNVGFNTATFAGAGIYLDSSLGPTNMVIGDQLDRTDPRPLIIQNEASTQGGGIYAAGNDTTLTINTALIGFNTSGSLGGGIQVRNGSLVSVTNPRSGCSFDTKACTDIQGNEALSGGGVSVSNAQLTVERARIIENTATSGSAAFLQNQGARVELENVQISDNDGASVIYASSPSSSPPRATTLAIRASTIVDNTGAFRIIELNAEGEAFLGRTLIQAAPGVAVAQYDAANIPMVDCSYFHEIASIPGADAIADNRPGFVNAAMGDYRPSVNMFFGPVDRCAASTGYADLDLNGFRRPYDAPLINADGPFDIGAFEGVNDLIFADGFQMP